MGTLRRLSTNGPSSFPCVSGMVQTGGAFLSNGLGISIVDVDVDHDPLTRFCTAWGVELDPSDDGSSVAQFGSAERHRREVAVVVDARRMMDEFARRDEESIDGYELGLYFMAMGMIWILLLHTSI